jgi:hypothetical protein
MKAGDGGFLSSMLGRGGGKDAADFADEGPIQPQLAGLIEKISHLCAHVPVTGGRAKDDGIGLRELVDRRDGNGGKRLTGSFAPVRSRSASGTSSGT